VTEVLVPQLWKGAVVIMDNLNLHVIDEVREAIEDAGANLIFLSTYSPELSPIKLFWAKVKAFLRSIAPRTKDELNAAITDAFNAASLSNISGWFSECDARTVLI
jgi:transposase